MLLAWDERDRERVKQVAVHQPPRSCLVSLDLAGWLAFLLQHRIVQASHAAVLRRRTEVVESNGTGRGGPALASQFSLLLSAELPPRQRLVLPVCTYVMVIML